MAYESSTTVSATIGLDMDTSSDTVILGSRNNKIWTLAAGKIMYITSSKPVYVTQFIQSQVIEQVVRISLCCCVQ